VWSPKGALDPQFLGVDVSLEDHLGVRGDLDVDRLAANELHRLLPQKTGEHHLVHVLGQRRGGRVDRRRIAAEGDRHGHPFPLPRKPR